VHLALQAAESLAAEDVTCDVLDLRSLAPLDEEAVLASAAKTGRVLVVDEAYSPCGVGAEIAALVNERAFRYLRAPVLRLHTASVSHPFSPVFDPRVTPQVEQVVQRVRLLLEGGQPWSTLTRQPPVRPESRPQGSSVSSGATGLTRPPAAKATPTHPSTHTAAQELLPILIPNQGLTVTEARIVRWLVAEGDAVRKGQALFEIETDKVVVEVEAEVGGVVDRIVAEPDSVLPLGATVAWLRVQQADQ
jgi:2-oxoisovalerate dehydrogenase E1 component